MKRKAFSIAKILTALSFVIICLNMFFSSYEKGQLIMGLFSTLLFGIAVITELFPQYLDSISQRFFSISVTFFSASLYFINTAIFLDMEQPFKNTITVLMVFASVAAGIGLSYPFRKLKHYLSKKNLIDQ